LTVKLHSRYVKESEPVSENFRSLESDILTPTRQPFSASIHRGRSKTKHLLSSGVLYFS